MRLPMCTRGRVAHGVRDVDRRGAGLDGGLDHFAEKVVLGSRRVLRRELDVVAVGNGAADAGDGSLHDLRRRHFQLELAVDGAGRQKHVNPRRLGVLERLPGAIDVRVIAAGQAAHRGAAERRGDLAHRLEVAGRGNRKTGLQNVDPQVPQGLGHFHLLRQVHAAAGRLLPVPQRRVEDHNASLVAHEEILVPSLVCPEENTRHALFSEPSPRPRAGLQPARAATTRTANGATNDALPVAEPSPETKKNPKAATSGFVGSMNADSGPIRPPRLCPRQPAADREEAWQAPRPTPAKCARTSRPTRV